MEKNSMLRNCYFNDKKEIVQFNSGGMFKIEAFQGDKQLKLKTNFYLTPDGIPHPFF